ncbi:hypothetical protein DL546_005205 [Coniochaeta pulveracea]|uniref:Uncharacterized protein n=1 Tax=Coniochaeta pulveracea TaxID=177199 RepID=A0A420YGE6_9PEZI|nr:hypothetical protein DL546_005205 [Coniochaeta pulveracea]
MAAGVPTSLRVPFQADHGRRWPAMFLSQDEPPTRDGTSPNPGRYLQPLPGLLIGVILSLSSIAIISSFLTQKFYGGKPWRQLQVIQWVVIAIYADSWLFVFATAIIQFGFGVDYSFPLVYLFLVEKAYIIRGGIKRRLQSKLYIFNAFIMLGIYTVVAILNFVYRITKMRNGQCIIGMQKPAMIPLICFDVLVNVYLTVMFLVPLSNLVTFKSALRTRASKRLRAVATRTFIGALCTLVSSVVNLSVLMGLDGEPGWVCLMCCNSDILFNVIVIQWVISPDSNSPGSSKNDSQPLGTQQDDPDLTPPTVGRRLGSIRHGTMGTDQNPHYTVDGAHNTLNRAASLRREPSSEGMMDGRAAMSHTSDDNGSLETLPSIKTLSLHKELGLGPAAQVARDEREDGLVAAPDEVRVRDGNPHRSRIWRGNT